MVTKTLFPFLPLLLLLRPSSPLPDGAPAHVCSTMLPHHGGGIAPQDSGGPYGVFPAVTTLGEEQPLLLTLGSRQGLTFQGFMLQGRTSLAHDAVGSFRRLPKGTKALGCRGSNDTTTHSNTDGKGMMEFEWVPPRGFRGDVIFNATVAQDYATFWTGIESPVVRVVRSSEVLRSQSFYSGCGSSHLCFGAPAGCSGEGCRAAVKVGRGPRGDEYTFELLGPKEAAYVAAGLSDDAEMGDDSVMECVRKGDRVEVYGSVTHGKHPPTRLQNPKDGIELVDFNTENGQIYCKLTRKARTTVEGKVYDIDKQKYHLLIATGASIKENNVGYHDIVYAPTSEKLSLSNPTMPGSTTPPNFTPTTDKRTITLDDPFYDGCFSSKGCFGAPDGCVRTKDCKVVVATTVKGDRYEFEIMAPREAKYVAVGLSDDSAMGDDSVVECVNEEGNRGVQAYMSRTIPRPTLGVQRLERFKDGIELIEGRAADGAVYCKVQRDTRTKVGERWYDLQNEQYVLLVVAGPTASANKVDYHSTAYLAAGEKRFLSDVSELGGASKILIRLHGAFMLVAWVGTASVGILLARYYRQTWVGSQICGKDLWFAWHRFFMVCTWTLTTVAFILIFVELKAWSTERNPHAILGTVTTIICFLQPVGAFFRPHPGTPKRAIFNWLHWLGGNVAHILGIVTIFFAVKLNKAELPDWLDWILVGYVAFHVLVHLVLSILGCVSDRQAESRVTSFPMKDLGANGRTSHSFERSSDAPKSGFRKVLLFLYLLIIICFVAAMVVIVVMAPIEESWTMLRKKMAES